MPDTPDPTKPNLEIVFADGFAPPLPAGRYTIKANQQLTISSEPNSIGFEAEKTVYVSAPRFSLSPGEIYSVYPPAGQSGAFHTALPHIVLTRKTLPWERSIDGRAAAEELPAPWMVLLTLDDEEIAHHKIEIKSLSLFDFFNPPAGVWRPEIAQEPGERVDRAAPEGDHGDPAHSEQDHCLVAKIPTAQFREMAPAHDELRFLAHARQVGSEDKDAADVVSDGWFAVVVGNRRPRQGIRSHGLLVSLEGFGKILKQQRNEDSASNLAGWVQPAVLHHWTYVSEGQTFGELLKGLTEKDGTQKDVWLRILPDRDAAGAPDRDGGSEKALDALKLGYTALSHRMRQGSQSVSWYRGPLIPMPVATSSYHPIHTNADEALQYDPGTGFFNASYAAAWQLGRLLALQNLDFANSLLHRTDGYVARGTLDQAKKILKTDDTIEEKAKLLLQDDLVVGLLTEWWLSDPANADTDRGS